MKLTKVAMANNVHEFSSEAFEKDYSGLDTLKHINQSVNTAKKRPPMPNATSTQALGLSNRRKSPLLPPLSRNVSVSEIARFKNSE